MTEFNFADLEKAISPARASRYLRSTAHPTTAVGDLKMALGLYEHNCRLSAAAWIVIADLEVVLRNILADAMSQYYSTLHPHSNSRWYDDEPWFGSGSCFTTGTLKSIKTAKKRIKDPGPGVGPRPPQGRLIAELSLGFWRYLLIPRYEHSLWNPALRSCFTLPRVSGSDSRKEIHRRVEKLNYLRNRVAHHEPIYEPFAIPGRHEPINPVQTLRDAVELISWNDKKTAKWIERHNELDSLQQTRSE